MLDVYDASPPIQGQSARKLLLARMQHVIQWRGDSDMAQLSLYCQLFRGLSFPSSQRPTPSTMCTEKQSVAGPKTSAVKVPTTVIRRRAVEANSMANTEIMATSSNEHQKGPG